MSARWRSGVFSLILCVGIVVPAAAKSNAASAEVDTNAAPPTVTTTNCGDGVSAVNIIPTPNFNPLTATPDELDANDIPPKPSDPADLATWDKYVTSPITHASACSALSDAPSQHAYSHVSQNWAGNVATSHAYGRAKGYWHIPGAGSDANHANARSCTWVGIGQGSSKADPLIQAGSETDGQATGNVYLWWEVYPQQQTQKIISTYDQAGDLIWVKAQGSATQATIDVQDLTRGFSHTYTYGLSNWSSDNTAEWIVERTHLTDGYPYLTKLTDVTFTTTQAAYGGTFYALGDLPHAYVNMYNCPENTILEYPGAISADGLSFTEYWQHYGDNYACG